MVVNRRNNNYLKNNSMQKILFVLLFLFSLISYSQDKMLDEYIRTGLKNNIALQQKLDDYRKSIFILKEAKGMFYPSLAVKARYSRAQGGREIEFPVGDLLNPVYENLNIINNIAALDVQEYPKVENQTFNFYRSKEHDTKIELVQPIFNPEIYFNKKIKDEVVNMKRADAEAYKRHLVEEIKTAYYDYLMSLEMLELLNNTKELLKENVRVNTTLFEQNKVTIDHIHRSKAELSKLEQKISDAIKNKNVARSYFNFLLNRELEEEVKRQETAYVKPKAFDLDSSSAQALRQREEIAQLEYGVNMSSQYINLQKSNKLPTLTAVVDYGFQGEEYSFTDEDDYVFASLVLRWDLFKGLQNKQKIQQAAIDREMMHNRLVQTKKQIELKILQAYYDLKAAYQKIDAASQELQSMKEAYKIINKKYKTGQVKYISYMDARTNMTNAEQQLIIARYDYLSKLATFEKEAALYNIPDIKVNK